MAAQTQAVQDMAHIDQLGQVQAAADNQMISLPIPNSKDNKKLESIYMNEIVSNLQEKINIQNYVLSSNKSILSDKKIINDVDIIDESNFSLRRKFPIYARWPKKGPVKLNFGDRLNPVVTRILSGRTVYNQARIPIKPPAYMVIGSAAKSASELNSIIWGMGYISDADSPGNPGLVTAVRGPRTRKKMLEAGIECPEVYGDPALLLPYFYNPVVQEKKGIGLILHYREFNDESIRNIYKNLGYRLINLNASLSQVIKDIKSSSAIISSSLHGLIASHAYGVPVVWAKFSDLPLGDGFKFHDYLESMGFSGASPLDGIEIRELTMGNMEFRMGQPLVDLRKLLANCPFLSYENLLSISRGDGNIPALAPLLLTRNIK